MNAETPSGNPPTPCGTDIPVREAPGDARTGVSVPQTGATPASVQERVNQVCEGFEAALQQGQQPRVEDFLAGAPFAEGLPLLEELVRLELSYRFPKMAQDLFVRLASPSRAE